MASGSFTLTGTLKLPDKVTPIVNSKINIAAGAWADSGDKVIYTGGKDLITDGSGHFSQTLLTEAALWYLVTSQDSPPAFDPKEFLAFPNGVTKDLSEIVSSSISPSDVAAILAQLAAMQRLPLANAVGLGGPFTPGTYLSTDGNTQAVGYDQVDGLLIGAGQSNIFTSTDHGATWSTGKGIPLSGQSNPGNTIGRIIRSGSSWVAMMTDQSTGKAVIYTSPAPGSGGTCTWSASAKLAMTAGSLGYFHPCLGASAAGTLLVGEYGDPLVTGTPTLHVYRSVDNGATWATVFTLSGSGARHVHAVHPDTYVAGQWWMSLGDGPSPCLYRSTDDGVTWTGVAVIDASRQVVQISDDPNYLYLAPDATGVGTACDMWVLDKATLSVLRGGSMGDHRRLAVPDPGYYHFGAFTNGSPTMQDFNAANFGSHLIGARVISSAVPAGTTVTAVASTVQLTLSANASLTTFNTPYRIVVPEHWWSDPFYGRVDPGTGIYYFTTPGDSSVNLGNGVHRGLFAIPYLGGPVVLLDQLDSPPRSLFIANGWVYCGNLRRPALVPA